MEFGHKLVGLDGFRLRGMDFSRVDAFSDVVFGFGLTLLVVSLEVPKTFNELHAMIGGFVPFAISFCLLMMIWYEHYQFFRRFGLHDFRTIVLNSVLLFVVLFYVYPMKFLFTVVVRGVFGAGSSDAFSDIHQVRELFVLYGLGFAAVYLLIAALYWNAWRQREQLDLDRLEQMLTRNYIIEQASVGAVGLLSCVAAFVVPPPFYGLTGFIYCLIGPVKWLHGRRTGKMSRRVRGEMAAESALIAGAAEEPLEHPETLARAQIQ